MAGVVEEIVEIRWLSGCQHLIGECGDFELYSVVDRKPVAVTQSLTCWKMAKRRQNHTSMIYVNIDYALWL